MENQKVIKVYHNNELKYIDFDIFIISNVENNFFLQHQLIIDRFLFDNLKIEEEDRKLINARFNEERLKIEDYLINKKDDKNYMNVLYNYLYYAHFNLLNRNQKIFVLDNLKVDRTLYQQIFKDFNVNEKNKST